MNKWFRAFIMVSTLLIGIVLGMLIRSSYLAGQYDVYSMAIYGCHDGCSIATKDNQTGFLTNKTWDCWDECSRYIKEIIEVEKCFQKK